MGEGPRCSFCGKLKRDVKHMVISVTNAKMCNKCVTASFDLIAAEELRAATTVPEAAPHD